MAGPVATDIEVAEFAAGQLFFCLWRASHARAAEALKTIDFKGRRTLHRTKRLVAQVEDEVLGGLTGAERGQLLTLLRRAVVSAPSQPAWRSEEGG